MAEIDYTKATEADLLTEQAEEYRAKKIREKEDARIANFYDLRTLAFEELATKHNDEKIALQALWQKAEDNDYTAI